MDNSQTAEKTNHKPSRLKRLLRIFGPGIITGAADDDPSGIATYSQTGAQFGYGMLWTALYQLPLILAIQEACARIGAVTGRGLAGVIKKYYSKKVLSIMVLLVVVANIINIGADLGAIAAAAQLVYDLPFWLYAIVAAVIILLLEIFVTYKKYVKVLKWLTFSLLAYVFTALIVKASWTEIAWATLIPRIEFNFEFLFIVTGVFGTTITPYMFFWQASEEVEEQIARHNLSKSGGAPRGLKGFLASMRLDTGLGMVVAELAQWFIIITTATVLFKNGITDVETAADAARALEPLVQSFPNAGQIAKLIFASGIIGIGFLAVPVLAGSAAYAISEAFDWQEGLAKKFKHAPGFYGVIIVSTLIGLLLNFIGFNPMRALVFTAVINGVLAVPLIFVIGLINQRQDILGEYRGKLFSRTGVWLTFVVMALSAIGLFYTLIFK